MREGGSKGREGGSKGREGGGSKGREGRKWTMDTINTEEKIKSIKHDIQREIHDEITVRYLKLYKQK